MIMAALALFAPLIAPYGSEETFPDKILEPPSLNHWFGTDSYGMDVFSRALYAPRIDLAIAIAAAFLSLICGTILGELSGYYAGHRGIWGITSEIIMRIMEIIQSFPVFILAMMLVMASGQKIINVIYALAILWIPVFARLARAEVIVQRESLYIKQAKVVGNPSYRIIFRHLLPNTLSPIITEFSILVGANILMIAGLSFVGAGVRVPTAEWGLMISTGAKDMIRGHWWPSFFPGLMIGISVFGLSAFGEGLGIFFDPSRRRL
jgi:peptide/nickel transport system permease protein